MEITWEVFVTIGYKFLFESNNNLSNRKCPWQGKFSSPSGINFYLNQIIIHLTWNGNNMGIFWFNFYLNQIIIHLIRNVNNVGIFWFNFYLNQIKWYLVWENTSVFQSTLVQHIGYANHRLPKIGEFFFVLSPQGKQNFWKCNILSDKWLWFLVIFGSLGRFKGYIWGV